MKCSQCSAELLEGSSFCSACGAGTGDAGPGNAPKQRRSRLRFPVLALATALLVVAASAIGAASFYFTVWRDAEPTSVSRQVSAADGDTLALSDNITLRIPPGALSGDTRVTIARSTSSRSAPAQLEGGEMVGPAFDIDLGDSDLSAPVTIEIQFDSGRLPADTSLGAIFLGFYDEETQAWIPVGGTVDRERGVVTIETIHLSWWAAWTWNWEAWIAVLKQGLSLELSEWVDGFELLTAECNKSGQNTSVDESKANNVLQGCISNDDPASPEFRVVNTKSFHIGISPATDGPGYPPQAILGPGESAPFVASSGDFPPAVVYAEFTEPAMRRFAVELVARMLPAGDLIPSEGLAFIADGLERTFAAGELSAALDAGDERGAAEQLYQLITGESFIETFLTLAAEYGQQNGVDMMTKWTVSGVRQVLLGVGLVDGIISATDFIANYFFNNRSQVSFSWKLDVTPTAMPRTFQIRQYSAPPAFTINVSRRYNATISTALGDIQVELFDNEAPETVNNFIFLAEDGFYDGLTFYFVAAGFSAQAGDPVCSVDVQEGLCLGDGGPGYDLDEQSSGDFSAGIVGMANASQFFIALTQSAEFDGYARLGRITSGMDVAERLRSGTEILTITIIEE